MTSHRLPVQLATPTSYLQTACASSTLAVTNLLEHDMSVLGPALDTNVQDHIMLRKVRRVMVVLVVLHRLPRDIDEIGIPEAVDGLQHAAPGDAPAPVDVSHDVRPQRPRTLVPRGVGVQVDGRADGAAEQGRPERVLQGLVADRGVADLRMGGGAAAEFVDDGEELAVVL